MIFRVTLKVGYNRAFFDFNSAQDAGEFASNALAHSVSSEDTDKETYVAIKVMNDNDSDEEDE